MIVFSGELSGKCRKYAIGRVKKAAFICSSIAAILFTILTVIVASKTFWLITLFIPIYIAVPFAMSVIPKKNYPLIMPTDVIIDTESSTIIAESSQFHEETMIEDVVRVLDMGEWYHIHVKNKAGTFICQKDLICKGALHDFEELFKSKIIVTNKELPIWVKPPQNQS